MADDSKLTYKRRASKDDLARYIKVVAVPISLYLLAIVVINNFAAFGRNLLAHLTGVMWIVGVICAAILPSLRSSIIKETHVTIGSYLCGVAGLKALIALASGVSTEMLMETYNQAIPITSGSAIAGLLQSMLWISAVTVPLGFIGMEIKKVFSFRKKRSKSEALMGIRNIRDTNAKHME